MDRKEIIKIIKIILETQCQIDDCKIFLEGKALQIKTVDNHYFNIAITLIDEKDSIDFLKSNKINIILY